MMRFCNRPVFSECQLRAKEKHHQACWGVGGNSEYVEKLQIHLSLQAAQNSSPSSGTLPEAKANKAHSLVRLLTASVDSGPRQQQRCFHTANHLRLGS